MKKLLGLFGRGTAAAPPAEGTIQHLLLLMMWEV